MSDGAQLLIGFPLGMLIALALRGVGRFIIEENPRKFAKYMRPGLLSLYSADAPRAPRSRPGTQTP